jgi:hypothetical protein
VNEIRSTLQVEVLNRAAVETIIEGPPAKLPEFSGNQRGAAFLQTNRENTKEESRNGANTDAPGALFANSLVRAIAM